MRDRFHSKLNKSAIAPLITTVNTNLPQWAIALFLASQKAFHTFTANCNQMYHNKGKVER
ncbi:hypothetical protein H6F77_03925 [Microcoleus sp. FACHB-831]|uniref:hypothetical protein n=1 Tax=Microcoleus sp. FACHB-831 TaxID=2692827 RepID=UPI00168954F8|nr:hypothetical protein [Microcoleus sp. FACHB-831]MBD1920264.1 hypothetical protein [Microcoleus sp. FACHB-831]